MAIGAFCGANAGGVAIGYMALAFNDCVAVGNSTTIRNSNSTIAIGNNVYVAAENGIGFGTAVTIGARYLQFEGSRAFGNNVNVYGNSSMVIGNNLTVGELLSTNSANAVDNAILIGEHLINLTANNSTTIGIGDSTNSGNNVAVIICNATGVYFGNSTGIRQLAFV